MAGLSALEQDKELPRGEGDAADSGVGEGRILPPQERLGGARADFVAMLGRRVADIAGVLRILGEEPGSARLRDDLRRRLHALSAGAKLLRFTRLAEEVSESLATLTRASDRGAITPADLAEIRAVLDRVPALAWGDASVGNLTPTPARSATPRSLAVRSSSALEAVRAAAPPPSEDPISRAPLTVLVVGPHQIADALLQGGDATLPGSTSFEVERTAESAGAVELVRAVAPDVVVIDADRPGARSLCEALSTDPLTELTPIIVLGRWTNPDAAAPYVALGVARTLPKPVSPDVLRRACADAAATYVRCEIERSPLGDLTVDDLGARLAEELRRGLSDAAVASGRSVRIGLGEGSEVLAALWGAVARIRDLVTIQSQGEVRFAPSGPEGALPLAPWLGGEDRRSGRSAASGRQVNSTATDLARKVIVVADDDPAVTWFLSGVLQAAGATVHEALDGSRALETAFRFTPDLVISDVLMPGLDGFALCRALKRDLVLRDVPVILLSWKEDLLQRVSELGAAADGYLRKEASAAVIVQRVREVLRVRSRVAERLASAASPSIEVRGRLDGLTTRTLLGLACAHRPASTVTVRDAAFLYEVEIRNGRPVRATRTAPDGSFERGHTVLAALLGVGAGRFVVSPAPEHPFPPELEGSLDDQLLPRIALARAAQRLLSGVALIGVERVEIAEDRMSAYSAATPDPARSLLRSLVAGVSPRALITSGQAPARLVEDVLCDAAAHGAIMEIIGPEGDELLEEAIEREIRILRGEKTPRPRVQTPLLNLGPVMQTAAPPSVEAYEDPDLEVDAEPADLAPQSPLLMLPPLATEVSPVAASPVDFPITLAIPATPSALPAVSAPVKPASDPPRPAPVPPRPAPVAFAASIEALGSSFAPAAIPAPVPMSPLTPVTAALAASVFAAPAASATAAPAEPSQDPAAQPLLTLGSLTPPPVMPTSRPPSMIPRPPAPPAITSADESPSRAVRRPSSFAPTSAPSDRPDRVEAPDPARKDPTKDNRMMWVLFAVAGIVFAVGARLSRDRQDAHPAAPPPVTAAPVAVETAAPAPIDPAPPAQLKGDGESKADPILPTQSSLRPEDQVPPGQGMLEVTAGANDVIYIDNTLVGNGPIVKRALAPRKDPYEIRVKLRGEERVRFVLVKEGRLTRLRVAPPWSR